MSVGCELSHPFVNSIAERRAMRHGVYIHIGVALTLSVQQQWVMLEPRYVE